MRRTSRLLRGVLAAGLLAALVAGTARGDSATRHVGPVYSLMTAAEVGSSTLVRTDSGVAMTLETSGLAPGTAATVWWVVFNNPELCTHGDAVLQLRCGEGDLLPFGGDPAVQSSLLYATGHVIGDAGIAGFGGYLGESDTSGALFGPGLLDSRKADVHLIVRSHGQAIPGLVDEQISSFNGGCPPNTCMNVQAAPHEAS